MKTVSRTVRSGQSRWGDGPGIGFGPPGPPGPVEFGAAAGCFAAFVAAAFVAFAAVAFAVAVLSAVACVMAVELAVEFAVSFGVASVDGAVVFEFVAALAVLVLFAALALAVDPAVRAAADFASA